MRNANIIVSFSPSENSSLNELNSTFLLHKSPKNNLRYIITYCFFVTACRLSLLLRLFIEPIEYMYHKVTRKRIMPCFSTSLRIEYLGYITKITKNIKTIYHHGNTRFDECFGKTCIPNKIICIGI